MLILWTQLVFQKESKNLQNEKVYYERLNPLHIPRDAMIQIDKEVFMGMKALAEDNHPKEIVVLLRGKRNCRFEVSDIRLRIGLCHASV